MANYDLTYEGSRVQGILDTGNSLKDAGYIFRGEATPSTVPGTPTERVAYIGGPGTYTNFGNSITVGAGCVCIFKYTGSAWSNQVIDTGLSNGYVYAGVATPSTSPVTGKVFYLAVQAGTYTNFGNAVVTAGLNVIKYNGSVWSVDQVIAIDAEPTQGSANLVKSGGVLNSIIQNGSAFDLSAYNAQGGVLATYADLSAALTALNALPADFKKGGMSMKFVLSSDNKYVQFRYMGTSIANADFTNVDNWQGVDEEPTADSDNLVKSGGVYDKLSNIEFKLGNWIYTSCLINGINNYYLPFNASTNEKYNIDIQANGKLSNESPIALYAENTLIGTYCNGDTDTITIPVNMTKFKIYVGAAAYVGPGEVRIYLQKADNILSTLNRHDTEISRIDQKFSYIDYEFTISNCTASGYIKADGTITALSGYNVSDFTPITEGKRYIISNPFIVDAAALVFFKSDKSTITRAITRTVQPSEIEFIADEEEAYIRVTFRVLPQTMTSYIENISNYVESKIPVIPEQVSPYCNLLTSFDNLLCVGDSLTYSQVFTSSVPETRQARVPYPDALARLCGNTATILAQSGDTASNAWNRWKDNIPTLNNCLAIVYLGTNAGLTNTLSTDVVGDDMTQWADNNIGNYCRFVKTLKDKGYRIMLIKPWTSSGTGTSSLANTKAAIDSVKVRFGCLAIEAPVNQNIGLHFYPDGTGYDVTHYNDLGYSWFASQISMAVMKEDPYFIRYIIPW